MPLGSLLVFVADDDVGGGVGACGLSGGDFNRCSSSLRQDTTSSSVFESFTCNAVLVNMNASSSKSNVGFDVFLLVAGVVTVVYVVDMAVMFVLVDDETGDCLSNCLLYRSSSSPLSVMLSIFSFVSLFCLHIMGMLGVFCSSMMSSSMSLFVHGELPVEFVWNLEVVVDVVVVVVVAVEICVEFSSDLWFAFGSLIALASF